MQPSKNEEMLWIKIQIPTCLSVCLTPWSKQNPSWEANSLSASQEIPQILQNPAFHYELHQVYSPSWENKSYFTGKEISHILWNPKLHYRSVRNIPILTLS